MNDKWILNKWILNKRKFSKRSKKYNMTNEEFLKFIAAKLEFINKNYYYEN